MKGSFVLVASVALLTACVAAKVERDSGIAPQTMWEATLAPASGHTLHGTVTVTPIADDGQGWAPRSRVAVSIVSAAPGSSHAWHLHRGVCGSDGPIVGPAASYAPVPVGSGGAAQLIAEMPIRLSGDGPYFAHVHETGAMGVEACGALLPVGGPTVLTTR
jgi:hypothetical protein